jgi:hypothetical protein
MGEYASGDRVGLWRSWHRNGVLATEGRFVAGLRNGRWQYRSTNGLLVRTADFALGDLVAVDDSLTPFGGEPDPFLFPTHTNGPGEAFPSAPPREPLEPGGLRFGLSD